MLTEEKTTRQKHMEAKKDIAYESAFIYLKSNRS